MSLLQSISTYPNHPLFKSSLASPTIKIVLDCLKNSDSSENAIIKYPNHGTEIALTAIALLISDYDFDQTEIFEEISKMISAHDQLY